MLRKGVKLLIKKMVDYKKALIAILENTLENVNAGNTNITEEEASVIIDHLTMLNKCVATVSKAYACEHVLHITSNKFDYLVRKGIIPHGRKRLGFNELSWWDVYVALNAQYHDNINLYEKWFPNATNNEIEDKIVEATISNWFEDEDASSDKVWEYFRVI